MIFISVISHGHAAVLQDIGSLPLINKVAGVQVVVLDNIRDPNTERWCAAYDITYFSNSSTLGFGANNNRVFDILIKSGDLDLSRDWFIVLNPDVHLSVEMLNKLDVILKANYPLCAVDLYKDEFGKISDDSIRNFPSLLDFVGSLLFGVNKTKIDKSQVIEPCDVDWAAGSLLIFKADHYHRLGGFESSYFMYCEDIDICFRSAVEFNCKVRYLPQIRARHLAQHGNRKIFSKHFYWHVTSTLRFLWRKFKALKLQGKLYERF